MAFPPEPLRPNPSVDGGFRRAIERTGTVRYLDTLDNENADGPATLGHCIPNDAAEVKIEAERKAGDLLKGMAERDERPKGRPKESHDAILSDLGIKPDHSSRRNGAGRGEW